MNYKHLSIEARIRKNIYFGAHTVIAGCSGRRM